MLSPYKNNNQNTTIMRKQNYIFAVLLGLFLFAMPGVSAQDQSQAGPTYVTVSTIHWNLDYEDFDMDTWKAVEKEYFDKVTLKNELVLGSGIYVHHFTPDNTELLSVNVYGSWDDIDKASERNEELAKEAWPDMSDRKAYFSKRDAYYADEHSDEIYVSMPNAKATNIADAKILFVRRSHFAFPEDGSAEEFNALHKDYVDNVMLKNDYILGYYPHAHAWGSDRTEFAEAYFFNSMADLENMFDKNTELYNAYWPDEAARKARAEKAGKYFTGKHGDYIYDVIGELIK
jgi:hypothetical protein